MNCDVMKHITKGCKFFTDWFMKVLEGMDYRLTISFNFFQILNSKLLAICKEDFYHGRVSHYFKISYLIFYFVAFDLLRIDIYGFTFFCETFLSKYSEYFISPLRLSGSAVETIFSQYKYTCGGKLDAGNYYTARAANLVKQVVANHASGKDYRNEELSTIALPLKK